ncbi:MAG: insulinase family protein [Tissierellales bacterium]|jgi:predicted Zn-dependent peptidase|nr:insulinase family protein [Tissierellales bacterium]
MIKNYFLKNGVQVLIEPLSHVKSASIGYWVNTGSVQEQENEKGVAHFIEHMLFKGTESRSAKEIATSMDHIGGQLNAFTSKECTCFYAKVLDEHINVAIDVIGDMIQNPLFSERDITREKGVVLEEISMYEDSPEDIVHDELARLAYSGHALSMPILGTVESIEKMTREDILGYYNCHYKPKNLVIVIVGHVEETSVLELLEKSIGQWDTKCDKKIEVGKEIYTGLQNSFRTKDIEQFHTCIGFPNVERESKDYYAMLVLNNIVGGSMSSRLFQKIREEMGMVYSIYSYPTNYKNSGMMTIYAGMNPNEALNVINTIFDEIRIIKENGIESQEFVTAKEQLKGNYILGLESTSSRMISYGRGQILNKKIKTQEEVLKNIEAVREKDIEKLIPKVFDYEKINISCISNMAKDNPFYVELEEKLKLLK